MTKEEIIKLDNENLTHIYGRLPLAPDHGKNATVYEGDGTKYIDFTAGIGVNSIGIANEEWCKAVSEQLGKIQHISNYYYSEPTGRLAETIVKTSGMKNVIFSNSGAEANEVAIKVARKYSYDKYGKAVTL